MKVELTEMNCFLVQFGCNPSHKDCINFDLRESQYPSEAIAVGLKKFGIPPLMHAEGLVCSMNNGARKSALQIEL